MKLEDLHPITFNTDASGMKRRDKIDYHLALEDRLAYAKELLNDSPSTDNKWDNRAIEFIDKLNGEGL